MVISKIVYFFAGVLAVFIIYFAITWGKKPVEPNPVRRKSPMAISATHIDSTYIKIVYGQPYKRGRHIFGGLVDFNEVWRTGANETTEITTTGNILINGEKLRAGTYAIFTIPRKKKWTIIFNDSLGQWGAFTYDKSDDVLRTTVPTMPTRQTIEAFTIKFGKVKEHSSTIKLMWDTVKVVVPITAIHK